MYIYICVYIFTFNSLFKMSWHSKNGSRNIIKLIKTKAFSICFNTMQISVFFFLINYKNRFTLWIF